VMSSLQRRKSAPKLSSSTAAPQMKRALSQSVWARGLLIKPWIGFGGARRVKLYNKTHIRQPDHAAWDQLQIHKGARIIALKEPLIHYSFADAAHLMRKQNRVSTVRANETKLKPIGYLRARILLGFPVYFLRNYIQRGMFRGGIYGFVVAAIAAQNRWLKDVKMYEIHRMQDKQP